MSFPCKARSDWPTNVSDTRPCTGTTGAQHASEHCARRRVVPTCSPWWMRRSALRRGCAGARESQALWKSCCAAPRQVPSAPLARAAGCSCCDPRCTGCKLRCSALECREGCDLLAANEAQRTQTRAPCADEAGLSERLHLVDLLVRCSPLNMSTRQVSRRCSALVSPSLSTAPCVRDDDDNLRRR